MEMQERITECYNIPENDKEIGKTISTARKAVDDAIYKAGQEESDKKWRQILKDTVVMAKLTGIRKVVEWIANNSAYYKPTKERYFCDEEYQTQKKKWGIKNGDKKTTDKR